MLCVHNEREVVFKREAREHPLLFSFKYSYFHFFSSQEEVVVVVVVTLCSSINYSLFILIFFGMIDKKQLLF